MFLNEVIDLLCTLETNNDPLAKGDLHLGENCARGILQIRPCVLEDVNRKYKTSYTKEDCFDVKKSKEIAHKYLVMWRGLDATPEQYARTWNGGPNGPFRKSTLLYWQRFQKLLSKGSM